MESPQIGSLNEKPLHACLKEHIAEPGDRFEIPVDGFVIDIVRGEELIEIQTKNFSSLKRKLALLSKKHKVRLVHPIAREKWIVKLDGDGETEGRKRKSPKRGQLDHVFLELVYIPKLITNPNFSLTVMLIQEEEVRRHDPKRGWRRKGWVTHERRLLDVVEEQHYASAEDVMRFVPDSLCDPFTTADLAEAMDRPRWLAQKMAYCLREMGAITAIGKSSRATLYERTKVIAKAS